MASSNSLLIAPPPQHTRTHNGTSFSAPSAPGIHDTLRASSTSSSQLAYSSSSDKPQSHLQSSHPLESRLSLWPQTQQNLHYTLLNRNYGISAPLIREMELGIVRGGESLRGTELMMGPGMGLGSVHGGWGRSVHEDVLLGKDWEIEGWGDIYGGGDKWAPVEDFHSSMERRLGMNW